MATPTKQFTLIEAGDDIPHHSPLTFGAEFEFSLAYLRPPFIPVEGKTPPSPRPDPHYEVDPRNVRGIANPLPESANYPEFLERRHCQDHLSRTLNEAFGYERALADPRNHFNYIDPETREKILNNWIVSRDVSVEHPELVWYEYANVEIQTAAYMLSPSGVQEVQVGLQALTQNYRINTNRFSSVHVHVGYGREGYTLKEVKHILAIWWVFEEQFFSMVEAHRNDNHFCRKIRNENFPGNIRAMINPVRAGLDLIMNATELSELTNDIWVTVNPGNKFALNILNLVDSGSKTIEFRLHEGTLDDQEVKNWIKFCCGLVAFGTNVTTERLQPWLEHHADDLDREVNYPIGALLTDMGLADLADWYTQKIVRMNNRAADEPVDGYGCWMIPVEQQRSHRRLCREEAHMPDMKRRVALTGTSHGPEGSGSGGEGKSAEPFRDEVSEGHSEGSNDWMNYEA